jgi:hypothetical protein
MVEERGGNRSASFSSLLESFFMSMRVWELELVLLAENWCVLGAIRSVNTEPFMYPE